MGELRGFPIMEGASNHPCWSYFHVNFHQPYYFDPVLWYMIIIHLQPASKFESQKANRTVPGGSQFPSFPAEARQSFSHVLVYSRSDVFQQTTPAATAISDVFAQETGRDRGLDVGPGISGDERWKITIFNGLIGIIIGINGLWIIIVINDA